MLERSACQIEKHRESGGSNEIGFPANGRTVNSKLEKIFLNFTGMWKKHFTIIAVC